MLTLRRIIHYVLLFIKVVMFIIKVVIRSIVTTSQHIYILAHCFYILMLLPLRWLDPKLYWTIEGQLFKWLLTIVVSWGWSAGYTVLETGADISTIQDDEAVVMVNHQSTGDILTLMTCLLNKGGVTPNIMWLMDKLFLIAPFGPVSYLHGDFFIQQGKKYRNVQVKLLRKHLESTYWSRFRKWLIVFPEGGFLRKRKPGNQRYARENNLPVFEHVTLPRLGAMKTIIETLRNHPHTTTQNGPKTSVSKPGIKWIIDITIGYPGYPNIKPMNCQCWGSGWRDPCKTVVNYRYYPIKDVPIDEDGLMQWLYQRFEEKEALLSHFYRTGEFPTRNMKNQINRNKPRLVKFSYWWFLSINIFYACSLYVIFHICNFILEFN